MELSDPTARVVLRVTGYQFPDWDGPHPEDGDWLRVAGEIDDGDLRWSFDDPCLMADEGRDLARWMMSVADGADPGVIGFIEPNLSMSVESRDGDVVTVGVRFAHESAPPGWPQPALDGHVVEVTMPPADLRRAAETWLDGAAPFPPRG